MTISQILGVVSVKNVVDKSFNVIIDSFVVDEKFAKQIEIETKLCVLRAVDLTNKKLVALIFIHHFAGQDIVKATVLTEIVLKKAFKLSEI